MGVPAKTPFTWHLVQLVAMCAPVSLNAVVLWSNKAGRHAVMEWQARQSVENPVWLGEAAAVNCC